MRRCSRALGEYFDGAGAACELSHVRQAQPAAANLIPYGIHTIPEISMVGATEEELTRSKTPCESGLARYSELAKGQMLGNDDGLLKILFDPETLKLLGVHIIGERAEQTLHSVLWRAWTGRSPVTTRSFHRRA